ncbi:EamA family transporter, partial [Candidatus Micrarchaeota archaeon]|nr:EamA family transporter [Candidatus Micrarchaeota archaeon]
MELGVIFAILAMLAWGTSDFFIGYSAKKVSSTTVLLYGKGIGVLILGVLVSINGLVLPNSLEGWETIILASLLTTIAWFMFSHSLKEGLLSILSPIGNSWSIVT